ncbi:MAG: apolipoprotein N-acyltransferase [Candidatus Hydrogenedens sp.]
MNKISSFIQKIKKLIKNPFFLSVATGIILFLCFPKFHLYFLIWIAFVPLLVVAIPEQNPLKVSLYFFISGWVFHSFTLNWLITNMFWVGGPAFIGYQCLSAGLSILWAMYGYCFSQYGKNASILTKVYISGLLWVGIEWIQGHTLTGFGWCNLGYSQGPDIYFSQLVVIGSVPFLSFFIITINMLIAFVILTKQGRWKYLIHAFAIILLVHFVGFFLFSGVKTQKENDIHVAIVQPCFPQEMKFDPIWYEDMVRWTIQYTNNLIENKNVQVVFWPEALIMSDYKNKEILSLIQNFTHEKSVHLITGTTRIDSEGNDYNSCIWVNPEGKVMDFYDKVHLAPFGEYLPLSQFLPFLRSILPYDVTAGKEQKIFAINKQLVIGPLICFEVLFSNMAYNLKKQGANLLAVLTNLSWFGATNALSQELEICRMRAIETRLPVIHCTNTGISGLFTPSGTFFPVNTIISKNQTFVYEPMSDYPEIGVRLRLGGIYKVPVASNYVLHFNPDLVSLFLSFSGFIVYILLLLQKKK